MVTFFTYIKQHKFPPRDNLVPFLRSPLSWYGIVIYLFIASICVVSYLFVIAINNQYLVQIPARGGTITEGVLGAPRVINPILATTETDIALTKLIFSGLIQSDSNGGFTHVLAESYTVSPDTITYTFILREKLKWSDGKPLTSADVAFTISKLSSPILHPDSYWQDINVSTPDLRTVVFTLPQPRPDFLTHASTEIIPKHIWSDIPDELFDTAIANLKPVGSGPFKYVRMKYQDTVPYALYLTRNAHYSLTNSYLDHYTVLFFANQYDIQRAINSSLIDMTLAASPYTATNVQNADFRIDKIATSAHVGLFKSKNDAFLTNPSFVSILSRSIDKQAILAKVEQGYGILASTSSNTSPTILSLKDAQDELKSLGYTTTNGILEKNGAPVGFSIAVENEPTLLVAAQMLALELGKLGILATIKAYDYGTFQDIISTQGDHLYVDMIRTQNISTPYEEIIPLYSKAYPFIYKNNIYITTPPYAESRINWYPQSSKWYKRTNKIWKFFTPQVIINKQ